MMAVHGFDAIIASCNTGHNEAFQADVRYLTQVGGFANEAAVFFPATGEPTCWIRHDSQPPTWWGQMQDWVSDVRSSRCDWGDNFTVSMREHRTEKARIGVVGIGGTPRSPDGLILYGTLARLMERFPNATFDSATEAMAEVRGIKSEEEIEALRRADAIANASIQRLAETARRGSHDHEVYAEMIAEMLRRGGEIPTLILWGSGVAPRGLSRLPPLRPVAANDVFITEVEARYAGYIAQVRHPVFLDAVDRDYAELHRVAVEAFNLMFERIRPGESFGDAVRSYTTFVTAQGFKPLAVPMHGRGLGEDLPLINLDDLKNDVLAQEIREGQAFVLGPRVGLLDESKFLSWGDTIAVGPKGARRLGSRPPEPIVVAS